MSRTRIMIWSVIAFFVFLGGTWAFWPRAVLVDMTPISVGWLYGNVHAMVLPSRDRAPAWPSARLKCASACSRARARVCACVRAHA